MSASRSRQTRSLRKTPAGRRVLMLGWEYPPHITGGLGTACRAMAAALVRGGTDVTFVLPWLHGDEPREGVRLVEARIEDAPGAYGTPCATTSVAARRRYHGDLVATARRFAAAASDAVARESGTAAPHAAASGRFDVVHAHDWLTYPAGIAAARATGAPLVVHVHSCEYDRSGKSAAPEIVAIEQAGFDAAARIVCVSRYTADVIEHRYRVDPSKVRVVHNAGPEGAVRERRGRRGRRRIAEPVVLFLGRVTYQKGPGVFLAAAARVARRHADVRFVVAGTGDLYHRTVEKSASLGLARRIHFTGFLDAKGVASAFRDADVYVMPSVSEPFGIAPLEAAAHGVPVLVSENSGVAEVLPSALTFDPADAADLARQLLRVLRDPVLRRRLASKARRELAKLGWDAQGKLLADVYAEVAR